MTIPEVHSDIRKAETIDTCVYTDQSCLDLARERIFRHSWQFMTDVNQIRVPGQVLPLTILERFVDEPILLTRDHDDQLHCLSNVCTHRGHLVALSPGQARCLTCRYHGRRFTMSGKFDYMPEFDETENFPTDADHLPEIPMRLLKDRLIFASVNPMIPFEKLFADVERRMSFLPWDELVFDAGRSRDYLVNANWALYCENYLEGFHIPFVHAALNDAIDYGSYVTECHPYDVVQIGFAQGGESVFSLPVGSPEYGRDVAAYYYFVFPNLMLNFYPWGLSLNVVQPLAVDRTKVSFLTFVSDPAKLDAGAGMGLDRVEREDEDIVENVQRGVRSTSYRCGRYSPTREQGVHHFHRLLVQFLNG